MSLRVSIAVDSTESEVLKMGVAFVRSLREGASLTVLHVLTDDRLEVMEAERPAEFRFADVISSQLQEEMARRVVECDGESMISSVEVIRGEDEGSAILAWLEQQTPDYVVIGVPGRSKVGKLIFGSTSQTILLRSSVPVLAVPA